MLFHENFISEICIDKCVDWAVFKKKSLRAYATKQWNIAIKSHTHTKRDEQKLAMREGGKLGWWRVPKANRREL